ncbi:MAG: hypothetical protein CVT49_08660 [candidate division Zixibacteria bacterium HGW-Zixibacteria-1]|nr:MAG: hypothetical protein CVT49_08660 [candidate division Zixibacteria bacterium HGW-Zixibacteria-1]
MKNNNIAGIKAFFKAIRAIEPEAILWILALGLLLLVNPESEQHFTLCLFSNLGLEFCPGCGLGRSIAYIYRGDPASSFSSHPLGIFVLIIILFRIFTLLYKSKVNIKHKPGGHYGRCVSITARDSGR